MNAISPPGWRPNPVPQFTVLTGTYSQALKDGQKMLKLSRMMTQLALRSPYLKTGGLVYFARMLDKIRTHVKGELPDEYQANLGRGFDASCIRFLRVNYDQLVDRVKEGGSDDDILHWCFNSGRRPSDDEIYVWNEFMRKRGWNDELSETLKRRKKESGMAGRSEIETMFSYIDADEGRSVKSDQ